jgi:hypothetical protein
MATLAALLVKAAPRLVLPEARLQLRRPDWPQPPRQRLARRAVPMAVPRRRRVPMAMQRRV